MILPKGVRRTDFDAKKHVGYNDIGPFVHMTPRHFAKLTDSLGVIKYFDGNNIFYSREDLLKAAAKMDRLRTPSGQLRRNWHKKGPRSARRAPAPVAASNGNGSEKRTTPARSALEVEVTPELLTKLMESGFPIKLIVR